MPRLYVGRLNQRVNERDLERFFDGYGKICDVMMKAGYAFVEFDDQRDAEDACYDLNGKDLLGDRILIEHAKGFERGFGGRPLIEGGTRRGGGGSTSYRDYDRGDRDRDGGRYGQDRFNDRSLAIRKQHAREKYGPPIRTKWQVRIENLSSRVSWQDLKDYARPHGEVTYADAHRKERGVAILCLASKDDLKNIIQKMDGAELNGKKVSVIDETVNSRSRSRSRSRSPHRSRSRTRSRSRSRQSRSKSRSRSRSKSRSRSPKRPASRSWSRSRSGSRN